MYPYEPPDGIGALLTWISGIGNFDPTVGNITANNVGPDKPGGGVLPFFMVVAADLSDDKVTQYGVYAVHSFATASTPRQAITAAYDAAMLVHRRVLAMGPPFAPQEHITLPSGKVVQCDGVTTKSGPEWVKYAEDKSIQRFVAEYDIPWRFVAAT